MNSSAFLCIARTFRKLIKAKLAWHCHYKTWEALLLCILPTPRTPPPPSAQLDLRSRLALSEGTFHLRSVGCSLCPVFPWRVINCVLVGNWEGVWIDSSRGVAPIATLRARVALWNVVLTPAINISLAFFLNFFLSSSLLFSSLIPSLCLSSFRFSSLVITL